MLNTIQAAVHAPVDASDISTPAIHGSIWFRYQGGTIEYPEIVTSTGNPDLDKLMIHQVALVQAPKPTGPHADEPHDFVLDLDMPTPFESFEYGIYEAINGSKIYPRDAIFTGDTGNTTVDFDYLDGKANNITLMVSSKNRVLDKSSLSAVTNAVYPPAPPAYSDKTLHMEVIICYSVIMSMSDIKNPCPVGKNVIQVTATAVRMVN